MFKGNFIDNLPKIYGLYTGGFVVFIILMAILEQLGLGADTIGILFVIFTVAIYAGIGWLSRTMQVSAYYVAGREVPPVFNGMATAADWMSGASFVALAGGIYFGGHGYLAFVVGWTGGYVLVNSLLAPYLRKFGCYTVPDFIGTRYGGNWARFIAVVILVVTSFTYVTAQINATGTIAARALHIPFEVGVWFGLLGILLCSMLGGMRAVTWTQVAQYIVLIIAYLIPVIWMSNAQGFGVIPHFTYGEAVARITELEPLLGVGTAAVESVAGVKIVTTLHNGPADSALYSWQFVTLALCMMAGTASLPHILMRYFTTPTVRSARRSVSWSLFFIFLLYFTAPALATLTKLQLFDPNLATAIIGKSIEEVQNLEWIKQWASVGMLAVTDGNKDGILQINEFFMRPDIVVLATPEIGGSALCDLGPRRGRRHGGRHVDGGRSAARHRQRAEPRSVLQDHRSEGRYRAAPDRRPRVADRDRRARRDRRQLPAHRYPGSGRLGLLLRLLGAVLPPCAGGLVETGDRGRRDRGDGARLRGRVDLSLVDLHHRRDVARSQSPAVRHHRNAGQPRGHGGRQPDDAGARRGSPADGGQYPRSQRGRDPGGFALVSDGP